MTAPKPHHHGRFVRQVNLWLDSEESKMLEELSKMNGISFNGLLRMILRKAFREMKKEDGGGK